MDRGWAALAAGQLAREPPGPGGAHRRSGGGGAAVWLRRVRPSGVGQVRSWLQRLRSERGIRVLMRLTSWASGTGTVLGLCRARVPGLLCRRGSILLEQVAVRRAHVEHRDGPVGLAQAKTRDDGLAAL